jgi:RNA polymerase sigma-70 factor (ECF subfamily)
MVVRPRAPSEASAGPTTALDATTTLGPDVTSDLITRAKRGDRTALDLLVARCLPALRRWSHGRLPSFARGVHDTGDIVQDAVSRALTHLADFESRHQGALQAYLRQAVMNRIRDVIRYQQRRGRHTGPPEELLADDTSPLDRLIGADDLARYEAALLRLRPQDREAIVGRIELQYSYAELALLLDKPTANAARVAVMRAIARLVDEIRHGG